MKLIALPFAYGALTLVALFALLTLPFDPKPMGGFGTFLVFSSAAGAIYLVFYFVVALPILLSMKPRAPAYTRTEILFYGALLFGLVPYITSILFGGSGSIDGSLGGFSAIFALVGVTVFYVFFRTLARTEASS